MAQEVGVAYVTLLPSGRGFGKAVEGQVDDALDRSEKKSEGFFSKLGTGIKRVAVGVAAVATGVAALAVGGGIARALNIEDAQAKLKGLGHDTQSVEAIMTNALAAVKGTAFGLDAAATTAAAAVASGIKPGQELEKYLRLTADAATIAGVSMEEMGSIINKVQAKGKAQMEDLNRLTERGIPIMQMLADEYGVTAEEMSKMVSRGEVDAARFRKALEDNVGGAALASGDTTRGAFANMMAALSRLGLEFVGPVLSNAKAFFNEITVILDGLAERFRPWIKRINEQFGDLLDPTGLGDRFLAKFDEIVSAISSGPIPQLLSALQPILPAVAELAGALGQALGGAARELGEALAPVLPLIAEELTSAVVELTPSLIDLVKALVPIIPELVKLGIEVLPVVVDLLKELVPVVKWVIEEALLPFLETITAVIDYLTGESDAAGFLSDMEGVGGSLLSTYDTVKWAFGVLMDAAQMLVDTGIWVVEAFTGIGDFFAGLWQGIQDAFAVGVEWWNTTWTGISQFFSDTWDAIGLALGGALEFIAGLLSGDTALMQEGLNQFLTTINDWWTSTWQGISDFFSGIWAGISSFISGALAWVSSAWNNTWSWVSAFFRDTWNNVVSNVRDGVNNVMQFFRDLPTNIMNALTGAGRWLLQTGKDIIQGLIDGVMSMVGSAVKAVQDIGSDMLSGIQSWLGIHSPSRVFRDQVGKMVGLGLLEGVEDSTIRSRIDSAVNHMVQVPDGYTLGSGSDGPATFNLYDSDGRLWGSLRGIVADALAPVSAGNVMSELGVR
ncbi:MAG: hypothetical protein D3X82_13795 [Candidatus Leucobacter sulfamidivorax]|nr:hypothetical protein [Candidatus Leucobacter sulfamidivorax]